MGKGGGSSAAQEIQETEQEKALASVAKQQWDRYTTVLAPFEDKFLKRIQTTDGQFKQLMGQAASASSREMDSADAKSEKEMFAGGINPNSGKFMGRTGELGVARGGIGATAINKTGLNADSLTYQNMNNAIKMGRGEATDAVAGMSGLARNSANEAIRASDLANRYNLGVMAADQGFDDSIKSSVATAAGMGLAGWKGRKPAYPEEAGPFSGGIDYSNAGRVVPGTYGG